MDKKTVENAIFEGGIEGLVMSLVRSLGKTVQEKGTEVIERKLFGLGTNDEELYERAGAYAIKTKRITLDQWIKVRNVIGNYPKSQSNRIRGMIGKTESEVTYEINVLNDDGSVKINPITKEPVTTKVTAKENVAGADLVVFYASMTEEQLKEELDKSNASNSFEHNVAKTVKVAIAKIKSSESVQDLSQDSKSFYSEKTWLEKWAESRKQTI